MLYFAQRYRTDPPSDRYSSTAAIFSCSEYDLFPEDSDTLEIDSIDKIELIMEIERHFNITITDEETSNIKNILDIHDLIINK